MTLTDLQGHFSYVSLKNNYSLLSRSRRSNDPMQFDCEYDITDDFALSSKVISGNINGYVVFKSNMQHIII